MKCMSCEAAINPKWKHAIDNNVCPCCGLCIMEEELKDLLLSLGDTISDLSKYQEQMNDWLLSNHNYIRTDSPELINYISEDVMTKIKEDAKEAAINAIRILKNKDFGEKKSSGEKFTIKVKTENGEEEDVEVEKIQDENTTNDFFKRAEAVKPNIDGFKNPADKTKKLKNLVQQIKKNGTGSMAASSGLSDYADPEAVAEMEGYISGGGEIASSLSNDGDGGDEIPSIVLAMANRSRANGNVNDANERDLQKLQSLQNRTASARENSLSGKGAFSRS